MPIYHYQPASGNCRLCGKGFECVQSGKEDPLRECPKCGLAVVRTQVNEVQIPKHLRKIGSAEARNAGFTVLKKTGSGEYEKIT
jgi:putative FmdB family regulatory protein